MSLNRDRLSAAASRSSGPRTLVLEISLDCVAMNNHKSKGFTLLELMVTIVVVSIILGIGVPSFVRTFQTSRMAGATNDLIASIHLARSEAVKRRAPVTLCSSIDPFAAAPTCNLVGNFAGWIVFVDDADLDGNGQPDGNIAIDPGEVVLKVHQPFPQQITTRSNAAYASFSSNGFRRDGPVGPSVTMMLFCDSRGNVDQGGSGSAARMLMIPVTGRPQIGRVVADIDFAMAQIGGTCP